MEPLLLISEDLLKGKGNRDGLIQQIVTYVRDGRTITRKQWVRSEFADHAKKDEEEKKDVILREQEREQKKRSKDLKDQQEKQEHADVRARKKVRSNEDKETHSGKPKHGRNKKVINDEALEKYKKALKDKKKQSKQEDEDTKDKQNNKAKSDAKKDNKGKGKAKGAFGQADQTRADNRRERDMM